MAYPTDRLLSLLALWLLFLCSFCEAKYKVRCSQNMDPETSMKPSVDGIKGRYTVEWCTNITKSVEAWDLQVLYNRKDPRICSHRDTHSMVVEYLDVIDVNCSSVCLSTDLDVIFSACYRLENVLKSQGSVRTITTHNISNEFTFNTFAGPEITGKEVNHGDYISATFFLGTIPATKYDVELCNKTKPACDEAVRNCSDASESCSLASPYEVRCLVRRLPAGSYDLALRHSAPWTINNLLRNRVVKRLLFNVTSSGIAEADASSGGWQRRALVGLGGTLGALCACGALLLAAARLAPAPRRLQHLRKRVLADWLRREDSKPPAESSPAAGPILLLYAREGPALAPVVDALTRLLETVAPGQVYDLYSAGTVAAAAASGDAWVRALMGRANVRVLLLQTPALRALHVPPQASEPLLGRRSVYRAPLAGDQLLPLALRLARHDPSPSYHKYYLATISGLETEALPYTVPFRRYLLPAHAPALLQHLRAPRAPAAPAPAPATPAPAAPTPAARRLADELALATTDFVDHARANPEYLMDQLIII